MSQNKVRVRFAPSPTGGLHLGGVRTALFNYLFARKYGGDFVLRVEDTDQTRFVPGAEEYILQCLEWCGLRPDESPEQPGAFGPYRQSERKPLYAEYAHKLVAEGHAYYAFDTAAELEQMRETYKTEHHQAQYDSRTRGHMRNSLTLSAEETKRLMDEGAPFTVRIKMPENEQFSFSDMIRGTVHFDTANVDDKVLLKADGMPTYHLAVVVDDYLMQITHAFRGEEWLPSAPVHVMLWRALGWEDRMPQWAHLPLILKPDGNGKLSKRDGDRLGFPVFAMDWTDPRSGEKTTGFRERGFLPEAFVNMLAMLGWNPGTEQELFSVEELTAAFSMERVHKGGAKFDFEKAKWFNNQYVQKADNAYLAQLLADFLPEGYKNIPAEQLAQALALVKDRMQLLTDFWPQASYLFERPQAPALDMFKAPLNEAQRAFFEQFTADVQNLPEASEAAMEALFNEQATAAGIKKGELMLPLRLMLVGGKFGPGVFAVAAFIGAAETNARAEAALRLHV